jgi:hypothetical protein
MGTISVNDKSCELGLPPSRSVQRAKSSKRHDNKDTNDRSDRIGKEFVCNLLFTDGRSVLIKRKKNNSFM